MTNALTAAVQSMQNDLQMMNTISQNMVNMATPGYKRAIPVAQVFSDALRTAEQNGSDKIGSATTSAVTNLTGLTPAMPGRFDISAGPVKQTGRPFDIAITGDGYFELATPDGPAYSRAGDFHLDASGRLVSSNGYAVQGKGGDIVMNGTNATIDHAGQILQDGVTVGQIKIVQFADSKAMSKTAAGLLHSPSPVTEVTPELQIGYLESSNVVPLREMVAMMQTTRHFESAQKLFQGYDDTMRSAIQKLGTF